MEREQKKYIIKDLDKKMVFIAGPRQAGKTWLAKEILRDYPAGVYLNYDNLKDRRIIANEQWLESTDLLVFDELHKMPNWKNYLKGVYDTKPTQLKILVTGSARLDVFNQVGDSLAGRYFMHHLMPLSPAELHALNIPVKLNHFLTRGEFPEPFLAKEAIDAERWRIQYIDSLLRVDVLDFNNIQNLRAIQLVFELLRERVGSPISYKSIAEDVGVSPNTVKKYIQILEALYIVFRVKPYSKNIARSILKEPKIYFHDTGLVKGNNGIKFENLVATSLLKHVYKKIDYFAKRYSLNYLRTKEKQEVDFALICDDKIQQIVEAKHTDSTLSKALLDFHQKYNLPAYQVVKSLKNEREEHGIKVVKAEKYLGSL